jgi:hypothetical protein
MTTPNPRRFLSGPKTPIGFRKTGYETAVNSSITIQKSWIAGIRLITHRAFSLGSLDSPLFSR